MAGKREATRRDLTERLLVAATARIKNRGLRGLRARDITADAQCGLGTIYKCYTDLDDLILHVNSLTIKELEQALAAAGKKASDPADQLIALASAYFSFAHKNRNSWSALFDHRMPPGLPIPDWHLREHAALFEHVMTPLAELAPQMSADALALRTRSMFSAVHGIVALSLEGRFVGVDVDAVETELATIVRAIAEGLGKH